MATKRISLIVANPCKLVYCGDYVFFVKHSRKKLNQPGILNAREHQLCERPTQIPAGENLFLANYSH